VRLGLFDEQHFVRTAQHILVPLQHSVGFVLPPGIQMLDKIRGPFTSRSGLPVASLLVPGPDPIETLDASRLRALGANSAMITAWVRRMAAL
jgi:hypothetical protein